MIELAIGALAFLFLAFLAIGAICSTGGASGKRGCSSCGKHYDRQKDRQEAIRRGDF